MNTIAAKRSTNRYGSSVISFFTRYRELILWTLLLLLINYPLFYGSINDTLRYLPDSLNQGQWWRIITYPLVHLSWYHFALDAGAFLMLYQGLFEKRPIRKLALLALCSSTSLILGIWMGAVQAVGLSGLSGIAHGLMAFSSLEALRLHGRSRLWGFMGLLIVVGKSLYELAVGHVIFEFMHLGLCGYPVAACHAGGVLGGLIAFECFSAFTAIKEEQK
jgi:rhomboid family GlyGly-CTERM serine protease